MDKLQEELETILAEIPSDTESVEGVVDSDNEVEGEEREGETMQDARAEVIEEELDIGTGDSVDNVSTV